jgi:deoxyribonuclease-4
MNRLLGGHLSVAGGYHNALNKTTAIGGSCLQIFASSPRGWNFTVPSEQAIEQFLKLKHELNIDPIYFHASYLINLANDWKAAYYARQSLINELNLAPKMAVKGSIIHLGSFKTKDPFDPENYDVDKNLINNITEILSKIPENALFIIENAGNKKVGQSIEEIAHIINQVQDPRVRVCLDTCHAYSAGYDLSKPEKLDEFLNRFEELVGLNRLEVVHFNDSKDPFDSGRDRHENIGKGTLGIDTFRLMLNHPKLKHLPFIIEVPGLDDKGPDKENLDILKSLVV